jgi:carotenoid cleavage dioxygenase-like enzyme
MAHFPDTPSFTGFNTPSRIEADIVNLAHQGTIPPELDGAFYRVQPDLGPCRGHRTGGMRGRGRRAIVA